MTEGISYQAKDILFKSLSELYRDDALKVFHLKNMPKIQQLLPSEYPMVRAEEKRSDTLFLMEDNSILMLEYESNSRVIENYLKYLYYAHRILDRYYTEQREVKKIRLVVVYTSNVTNAENTLDAGDLKLDSQAVFLSEFAGDHILYEIRGKIEAGEVLKHEEIIKLSILPLMNSKKNTQELIKETVELARTIQDERTQVQLIAGLLVATDKFINESYAQEIREWLKMTKVGRIFEQEKQEALKEQAIQFAKSILDAFDDEEVAKRTNLTVDEVRKLRKH
ncbi:transcriptional regulator (plasmid) [Aneurinibacillus sp. Ricciae_BoGa-3]|uniref:transcriptional regulator n=1 Tax=Aneurinibacillus sp. Ricciae_BoGa-3 TaxID=3022697 RepID=UPI00234251CB|nr:transcriptional regulator [Aneurinibacillus sp. Ricciae_BoGa-3]WCK57356.1 transcriptional regulator [Aneurinibacillus sp. Ricciae_BoGa-3]